VTEARSPPTGGKRERSKIMRQNERKGWTWVSAVAVAMAGALAIAVYAWRARRGAMSAAGTAQVGGVQVRKSVILNRPPEEVYAFWRDFENLPRFMRHLESVHVTGEKRSRWKASAPAGRTVEWDAEIVEDRPNELIAWRSIKGSQVPNSGSVRFTSAPGGRGTQVTVDLRYDAPAGPVGVLIARLLGEEPEQQVREDLRIFKQVMETGEVTLSDATVEGEHFLRRPAQPPTESKKA
jgi:uncharacterized membrane protein